MLSEQAGFCDGDFVGETLGESVFCSPPALTVVLMEFNPYILMLVKFSCLASFSFVIHLADFVFICCFMYFVHTIY